MCNVYYKKIKVFLPICKPIVKHLKNYTFRGTIQQLVTGTVASVVHLVYPL